MNQAKFNTKNRKLREKVTGFETEQATKNKQSQSVEAMNKGLKNKVESLEAELQNFRTDFQILIKKESHLM
eukprot:11724567-Ditylum_brightwellii.AAC.1